MLLRWCGMDKRPFCEICMELSEGTMGQNIKFQVPERMNDKKKRGLDLEKNTHLLTWFEV